MFFVEQAMTRRGTKYCIHEGYLFKLKIYRAVSTYWICKNSKCKVSITLNEDFSLKVAMGHHSHLPNASEINAFRCITQMKRRAQEEPTTPVPKIYK